MKKKMMDLYACFLYEEVNEIRLFKRVFLTEKTGRHLNKGSIQNKYNKKKLTFIFFMVRVHVIYQRREMKPLNTFGKKEHIIVINKMKNLHLAQAIYIKQQ